MNKLFALILSFTLIVLPVKVVHAEGGYANQIVGMSNGIVGSAVLIKCKLGALQPSIMLYMAGGVVFVISELTGGKKKAKDIDSQAKNLDQIKATMKEGGDYQKASVDMQLADQKSNLEFVEKRRKWMLALKAIYLSAAIAAGIEAIMRGPPLFKPDLAACTGDGVSHLSAVGLVATAYGALSASGSIGGMAVGMGTSLAVAQFLPKLAAGTFIVDMGIAVLNFAEARAAFFTATAAFIEVIDGDLKEEERKIKENIAVLEKVKAQFDKEENAIAEGPSTQNPAGVNSGAGNGATDPTKTYGIKELPKGSELAENCLSQGPKGEMSYSIDACKNPIKIPRADFGPNFELPTLQSAASTSADLAQALSTGNASKADIESTKLASMAGKLSKINEDVMKKVNERLKQEGKKPIDIKAEMNRQLANFNDGIKNNVGQGNLASAAGLNSSNDKATVSEVKKEDIQSSTVNSSENINSSNVKAADAIDLSKIESGAGSDANSEDKSKEDADKKVASLDEGLKQFEDNQSDISKDEGVSIFKQVSNRYLLNYDRIFKRKEIAPPLAEPQN